MALNSIAVLGNTFSAKILATMLAINHPNKNIYLYTNNETFKSQIKSPVQSPTHHSYNLLGFFVCHLRIPAEDILRHTTTTLGLGTSYKGLQDTEIINPLKIKNVKTDFINFCCVQKNFKKFDSLSNQVEAFFEWMVQTDKNLLDIYSAFPYHLYTEDPQQDLHFNFDKNLIPTTYDIIKVEHWLAGCYDIEGISGILDTHLEKHGVQIINEEILFVEDEILDAQTFYDNTYTNEENVKNKKFITKISTETTSNDINFVVNTGIDFDYFRNFIQLAEEQGPTLYEENETIVFTKLSETIESVQKPNVYDNLCSDNSFTKYLYFNDKTIIQHYNKINGQTLNTLQKKYLINQKYDSNYIEFDIEKFGLNPYLNEEIPCLIISARSILGIVSSCVLDDNNIPIYVNSYQAGLNRFMINCKKYCYNLFHNNTLQGYELFNQIPTDYNLNFENKVPVIQGLNQYGEHVKGDILSATEQITIESQVIDEAQPYSSLDYIFINYQKNCITNFKNIFAVDDPTFNEAIALGVNLFQAHMYHLGFLNFEDFKNIVVYKNLDYTSEEVFYLDDGTKISSEIIYVPIKSYKVMTQEL